ncbi:MAG: Asp-tRNA(Asn)/Glu-tRNA(Gln) amidotransferase subunit GatC [Candidatus Berkelbacteria bacterium]|nr:MAG: Asp-tRNA(Asn)/Glu-tRNA(Gln) amidotransferase subunit GatC [Candidatus Berkelbacteria bacterium]QQG51558.1 MAG: Asp-tRNA(Asn)/Glu-tRNA(Gln) amidotransferase subunit GatC [Candidatus Berkelbacteria bacterium]
MSELNRVEIDHLSSLARVYLNEQEAKEFAAQLPKIVDFVDQLSQANVEDVSSGLSLPLEKLRQDTPSSDELSLEQIKRLAPEFDRNQIIVPPVLGSSVDE